MKNRKYLGQSLMAIIDDSDLFISQIIKFFEPLGYKIMAIPEPMQGMGYLVDQLPQLILLGTHLSTIDGYSVCQFLRSTSCFNKTPIILLTDENNPSEREYSKFVGANNIFCKYADFRELQSIIKEYIIPLSTTNHQCIISDYVISA